MRTLPHLHAVLIAADEVRRRGEPLEVLRLERRLPIRRGQLGERIRPRPPGEALPAARECLGRRHALAPDDSPGTRPSRGAPSRASVSPDTRASYACAWMRSSPPWRCGRPRPTTTGVALLAALRCFRGGESEGGVGYGHGPLLMRRRSAALAYQPIADGTTVFAVVCRPRRSPAAPRTRNAHTQLGACAIRSPTCSRPRAAGGMASLAPARSQRCGLGMAGRKAPERELSACGAEARRIARTRRNPSA